MSEPPRTVTVMTARQVSVTKEAAPRPQPVAPVGPAQQASGIVSGPGNQGSSNTAHLAGQAGTAGIFIALPRQLRAGEWGSKPQ